MCKNKKIHPNGMAALKKILLDKEDTTKTTASTHIRTPTPTTHLHPTHTHTHAPAPKDERVKERERDGKKFEGRCRRGEGK